MIFCKGEFIELGLAHDQRDDVGELREKINEHLPSNFSFCTFSSLFPPLLRLDVHTGTPESKINENKQLHVTKALTHTLLYYSNHHTNMTPSDGIL